MATIGFIGVGVMGSGMAANLLRDGHHVRAFDTAPPRLKALQESGGVAAGSPADAASGADVVITMLPDANVVRDAVLGDQGAAEGMGKGTLLLEMSTVAPEAAISLGETLASRGLRMMDAPVGRPPKNARDGTLLILAGGSEDDFRTALPLFRAMGEAVYHVGPLGSGATLKVINNYMSMVGMLLAAETLTLGEKAGIDRDVLVKVLSQTAAGRGQLIVNYPDKVLAGDITPDFPMRLGLKDLRLALDLGSRVESPLCLGGVTREFFNLAMARGRAEEDCTAMLLLLEDLAGAKS